MYKDSEYMYIALNSLHQEQITPNQRYLEQYLQLFINLALDTFGLLRFLGVFCLFCLFQVIISFQSLVHSVLYENTEDRLHGTGGGRKKYLAVYILRLFLRLVESNGRKEIMRTETLKKERKKAFYNVSKIQHDALCFCYVVEKNV